MALLSGNAPLLPQNILPITNSFVFTCIVFVYIETTGGGERKKPNLIIPHRSGQNYWHPQLNIL